MAKSAHKPAVHVILDTNALYTKKAEYLVNKAAADLIEESKQLAGLDLRWYLPETVKGERKYQMLKVAVSLLPSINALERLLGHNLNITEEGLEDRVESCIRKHMNSLGLNEIILDTALVNWSRVADEAVFRKPPFDAGESEKGFRDALILEAFFQHAQSLPKTASKCRVILITDDERMRAAFDARVENSSNLSCLATLDELKGLINTLASEMSEELLAKILPMAGKLFFIREDKSSLYYKANIYSHLTEKFSDILKSVPEEGYRVPSVKSIVIFPPTFLSKVKQRVRWSSKISIAVRAEKLLLKKGIMSGSTNYGAGGVFPAGTTIGSLGLGDLIAMKSGSLTPSGASPALPSSGSSGIGGIFDAPSWETLAREGKHTFEVIWEATLSVSSKFTNASIDDYLHLDSSWENPTSTNG